MSFSVRIFDLLVPIRSVLKIDTQSLRIPIFTPMSLPFFTVRREFMCTALRWLAVPCVRVTGFLVDNDIITIIIAYFYICAVRCDLTHDLLKTRQYTDNQNTDDNQI
jgi:hypothetical protein